MTKSTLISLLLFISSIAFCQEQLFYVGTKGNAGIHCCAFNSKTGEIRTLKKVAELSEASFQCISNDSKYLFSVHSDNGIASVASFQIETQGTLKKISSVAVKGSGACFVEYHKATRAILTANYSSGTISMISMNENGILSTDAKIYQHEGKGPNIDRQESAHAHCIQQDLNSKYLYSCDLGTDKIYVYEPKTNGLNKITEIVVEPGTGPRHIDFHPNRKIAAVLNELTSSVSTYSISNEGIFSKRIETISSLPVEFEGFNKSADIHFTPNGKYLFASNRGHNSITTFAFDEQTKKIKVVAYQTKHCEWVRNFSISPNGKYLLAAARDSDRIVVFEIDYTTGELIYTGKQANINDPICITFIP